jgi:hypothetical protein
VYKNLGNDTAFVWSVLNSSEESSVFGLNSEELTILSSLFQSSYLYWMVELSATTTKDGTQASASTSMIFAINQRPYGGNCSADLNHGVAYVTSFNFRCQGWVDQDGTVDKYELYGIFYNFSLYKSTIFPSF